MNAFEENRAWEVFERELGVTRNPKSALRAALIDLESRRLPPERVRVACEERTRPLCEEQRRLVLAVCSALNVVPDRVCSYQRALGPAEVDARGVVVGILTDAGLSSRDISEGMGMSNSVVTNCRSMRVGHPAWEPLIVQFRSLMGRH
jgi:hypothetical protein